MAIRIVSLDLDGTLVHPAIFQAAADRLGFGERLHPMLEAYMEGRATLEEAFWSDLAHFEGLRVDDVLAALVDAPHWTPRLAEGLARLRDAGMELVLTTDQAGWLAQAVHRFDAATAPMPLVASPGGTRGGRITRDVEARFLKWPNLRAWLAMEGHDPTSVVHVGNGANDVPVWDHVGAGLAVFTDEGTLHAAAGHSIAQPRDFLQIAETLLHISGQER